MLEELKRHNAIVQERIMKSFGYAHTEDFIQKGEDEVELIQKGEIDYDWELEKAVYADTAENRRLNRVGQEYHRGKGKKDDEKEVKSNDLDFDTKTLLTHYVNRQSFPFVHAKMGQELDGHKIGEKNDKNEFWMPKKEYNGTYPHHSGHWVSKQELEDFENKTMMGNILKDKHYKSMPIGKEFKDNKGNVWKVVKHLPYYDNGYDGGRIRLKMTTKDGKSKTLGVDVSTIKDIKRSKILTTGISSLDKYIRENF